MQELWSLRSASPLVLTDIYMKFREDSLNGFQVIKQTRFCDRQMPGGGGGGEHLPTLKGEI